MPRAPKVDPVRLKTLEQRLAKVQRDLRSLRSQEKKQARADDARRKIIGGSLAENHALKNPRSDFASIYIRLLKEYVRPDDRPLFADTFRALLPPHEIAALLGEAPPKSDTIGTTETGETHVAEAAE